MCADRLCLGGANNGHETGSRGFASAAGFSLPQKKNCKPRYFAGNVLVFMSEHPNPMRKEFPIWQYKSTSHIKAYGFCEVNHISTGAFQKWIKRHDKGVLRSLARADSEIKNVLPEGIKPAEEFLPLKQKALRGIESSCPRLKKGFGKKILSVSAFEKQFSQKCSSCLHL